MKNYVDNLRLFPIAVGNTGAEFRLVLNLVDSNGKPTATVASFDATEELSAVLRAYYLGRKTERTSLI